jgi:formylglycine-generating enzyme required for sulfatase activity
MQHWIVPGMWLKAIRVLGQGFFAIGTVALAAGTVIYILSLVALNDLPRAADAQPIALHASTAEDGLAVASVRGDGRADAVTGDSLPTVIRGHKNRVVHAWVMAEERTLTASTDGALRITRQGLINDDTWPFVGEIYDRFWQRYFQPLSRWALSVSAQVLPLEIPERARGGRGRSFRDCEICPEMVEIKPGALLVGSPWLEADHTTEEGPRRLVEIKEPFAVGRFEVTFEEWDAAQEDTNWERVTGLAPRKPEDEGWGRGRRPVINVSWNDARAYVKWLSQRTGQTYRLLREAEWEYAARAGTTAAYPWGHDASHDFANYGLNECCEGVSIGKDRWINTAPVGSFPANKYGLHDMSGNVQEWLADNWQASYLNWRPNDGDLPRGIAISPNTDASHRVVRGGSWLLPPRNLRSASRQGRDPVSRGAALGFRVARTLTP